MLATIQRGDLTPPFKQILLAFLEEKACQPIRVWLHITQPYQVRRLCRNPHDMIIDIAPKQRVLTVVFLTMASTPMIVVVDRKKYRRIDLGPGIHHSLFKGTVVQAKYVDHTFHLCNVLLLKGEAVTDRRSAFEDLNAHVLPFFTRPEVMDYSMIPLLGESGLLFLPRSPSQSKAWSFAPRRSSTAQSHSLVL